MPSLEKLLPLSVFKPFPPESFSELSRQNLAYAYAEIYKYDLRRKRGDD